MKTRVKASLSLEKKLPIYGTKQTAVRLPVGLLGELREYATRRQCGNDYRWRSYTIADAIRDLITAGLASERLNVAEAASRKGARK